jgi:hypothetical protein|tara:strand:+ start:1419 stop:2567 length:1149 start_codon:yes stop_codon:yes gene_type:complete
MAVESKIRELLGKVGEVDTLTEEAQSIEEKAGLPNSKDEGDKTIPTQGNSNANPEQEDLSGSDDKGGLTSPVGKAASAKASKDKTLPKGNGAGQAPNFDSGTDSASVVNNPTSAGVREEEEVDGDQAVIAEDEVEEISAEDDSELVEHDIASLFADEEHLSEDFKVKAASIFEAVLTARVSSEIDAIESDIREEAKVAEEEFRTDMVEKIDAYLTYVAENWMKENELAIERGLRTEITEDFIKGMKGLFEDHYIEVPAEKYDVLGEMQTQIDELKTKLDENVAEKIAMVSEKVALLRQQAITEASTDLTVTESEKLAKLVENVEFDTEDMFAEKVSVIKENYFPKVKATTEDKMQDTVEEEFITENSAMAVYSQSISKAVKK